MADPERSRQHPVTVLVAEDDDMLRAFIARVLCQQGFRILEARHGVEALHLAEFTIPFLDLVIADVMMPGMDGCRLARVLQERWPTLPVLCMSAYPVGDIFHRGGASSAVPFLQKPFALDAFLNLVRTLLERAPLQPERPDPSTRLAG